jgi:chromosome segregation ATPase
MSEASSRQSLAELQSNLHQQIWYIDKQKGLLQELALARRDLSRDIREFKTELEDLKRTETQIQAKLKEAKEKFEENKLKAGNISRQMQVSENFKQDIEDDIRQYYLRY